MKEYLGEIVTGVVGITAAASAWFFGARQASKRKDDNVLTKGADKIVDSSGKLLDKLNILLEQEQERTERERIHRETCEESLRRYKKQLDKVEREVKYLKRNIYENKGKNKE